MILKVSFFPALLSIDYAIANAPAKLFAHCLGGAEIAFFQLFFIVISAKSYWKCDQAEPGSEADRNSYVLVEP